MTDRTSYLWRYWEGSSIIFAVAVPALTGVTLWEYQRVCRYIRPLNIDPNILLSYTLTLYAIGLGALLSLFALLASRPTEFLVRIRGTATFQRLLGNIKITMMFCSVVMVAQLYSRSIEACSRFDADTGDHRIRAMVSPGNGGGGSFRQNDAANLSRFELSIGLPVENLSRRGALPLSIDRLEGRVTE
jgi:hypothetical protein